MTKSEEVVVMDSCLNTAYDDEMLFVLLARDPAGHETVRFWCAERIRLKLNKMCDPKILSALACADRMESQQAEMRARRDRDKQEQGAAP